MGPETKRYAIQGAAFGAAFPLVATAMLIGEHSLPFGLSSALQVQRASALLWIIDTAPVFLGFFAALAGVRQDRLAAVLATREQVIVERTRELAAANQATKELLDNMQQAVFVVERSGSISQEHSAFTRTLFGDVPIAGASLVELLQLDDEPPSSDGARLRNWLEIVLGADELQWLMTGDEAIDSVVYRRSTGDQTDERVLELEYAPIFVDGVVGKVMVIAKDVTDVRALRTDIARKELQLVLIAEIVGAGRERFDEFMSDSADLLEQVSADPQALLRCAHTIKGNARMCGLSTVASVAHEVEHGLVAAAPELSPGVDPLGPLRQAIDDLARTAQALGGVERAGTERPPPDRFKRVEQSYASVLSAVGAGVPLEPATEDALAGLGDAVIALTEVPLSGIEAPLRHLIDDLERLTGKAVEFRFDAGGVLVSHLTCCALREILVHALGNAVDHGVEAPDQRVARGKRDTALVAVSCEADDDVVSIEVRDDGGGIDVGALKARCVSKGLVSAEQALALDDEAALELVFCPGSSTAATLTAVSGRGAGMAIIREAARSRGGDVVLTSSPGVGTCLAIRLPRLGFEAPRSERRAHPRRAVYYSLAVGLSDGRGSGRLVDASVGGMMMAHETPVQRGDVLEATIHGPEEFGDRRVIDARIRCHWTQAAPSGTGQLSGFSFQEVAADDLQMLDHWVATLGVSGERMLVAHDDTAEGGLPARPKSS